MNLPDENQQRYVAVLSKKLDLGRSLNVLGHLSAGLADMLHREGTEYVDYRDLDGHILPNISHYPFIVLKADNSNKIRKVKQDASERGIRYTVFTHTMAQGGSAEQQTLTQQTPESELDYWGICLFGDTETIQQFTSKLSLYK
ncbi:MULTISPECIES: DUF2000 domain-containing protein [Vibrio]|uniref:DUF2000 domain-containing protein n=1 Tax=Vibrio ostreae TaxID=2841925 RepID=A0A975U641_9VIBR|nr:MULTISPECIES: DUF2000 domain-containing protein [Vibrio]QXO15868.1 DUF2000 domain-containing protein [Vibrio ostreae]WGY45832.1 DUF2000 domain-containing protein [Vibrio sp. ABG19]